MKRKINLTLLLSLFAIGLTACGDDKTTPPPEPGPLTFSKVSAGGQVHYEVTMDRAAHTCALSTDGTAWCWGNGGFGQLGTGSYASSTTPVQVGSEADWIDIQTGGNRTCGIRGAEGKGTLWCWGSNRKWSQPDYSDQIWGLLGLGNTYGGIDDVNEPTQVGTAADWVQVGLANHHTCGIRDDGSDRTLWCWGSNSNGAIGNDDSGSGEYVNEPVQELGYYTDWASTSASRVGYESNMNCGIRDDEGDRTVWCMGYGGYGLPSGTVPTQFGADTDWSKVVVSGDQSNCLIKEDGTLYCASGNNHGQAGDGTFNSIGTPTQVGTDDTWTDVSIGQQHVCGINDGALYCWGRNHTGSLGLGEDLSDYSECSDSNHSYAYWDCNAPLLADDDNTWSSVSCGKEQCCGVTDGGDVYCWGSNAYGATGVTTAGIVYTPTKVE
jgi:alpha-tubulin suppressor-like RCC1 family protein